MHINHLRATSSSMLAVDRAGSSSTGYTYCVAYARCTLHAARVIRAPAALLPMTASRSYPVPSVDVLRRLATAAHTAAMALLMFRRRSPF